MHGDERTAYVLYSYAKINWFLAIRGLRQDGYHDITSLMQQVELADEIHITLASSDAFSCNFSIPLGEDSLLQKTVDVLRGAFPELSRMRFAITVKKSIPPGGGLGGGSSNAATLLRFLPRLAGYRPQLEELVALSLSLGSDIPFFVVGAPFALVEGRGERVTPLSFPPRRHLVLLFPPFPVSTSWAYRKWDERKREGGFSLEERLVAFLKRQDPGGIEEVIWNDFEEVLFEEYPVLLKYRNLLLKLGCRKAFLTGSGSTLVGVVGSREEGETVVDRLRKRGLSALWTVTRCGDHGGENHA